MLKSTVAGPRKSACRCFCKLLPPFCRPCSCGMLELKETCRIPFKTISPKSCNHPSGKQTMGKYHWECHDEHPSSEVGLQGLWLAASYV